MPHDSQIVYCQGPNDPHAFDLVPIQPRYGSLDAQCPVCRGHGQWNVEIDLISFRCKRETCGRCFGSGWVETGIDPVAVLDIVMTPDGYPKWVVRYIAHEELQGTPVLDGAAAQPNIPAAPLTAIP